jgi:serine phosphatase RsbU (regulator of sigma subunit)
LGGNPVPTVVALNREDGVLFRSDGILEARSSTGRFFGDERLAWLIAELHHEDVPPVELDRRCLDVVVGHQNGRPSDDATLVLLRWAAEADPPSIRIGTATGDDCREQRR